MGILENLSRSGKDDCWVEGRLRQGALGMPSTWSLFPPAFPSWSSPLSSSSGAAH